MKPKKKVPRQRAALDDTSFLEIDRNALDEEWESQPTLAFKYAQVLADAKEDWDAKRDELTVLEAELALKIRSDPEEFGIEKPTEKAIEQLIAMDEDVIRLKGDIRGAKHRIDVVTGVCNSLEHRKRALENLVQLWLSSYFAEPRAPDNVSREALDDHRKRKARRSRKVREDD